MTTAPMFVFRNATSSCARLDPSIFGSPGLANAGDAFYDARPADNARRSNDEFPPYPLC